MAADETGVDALTGTLTASTVRKFSLTGPGQRLELIHQAAVTNPVYYRIAATETALTAAVAAADENKVLLSGERLMINVPRDGANGALWLSLISAGAAVVSMELVP